MSFYRSKLGEVKTKQEWLTWADEFYASLGVDKQVNIKKPVDYWERVQKVLKLLPVQDNEIQYTSPVLTQEQHTYGDVQNRSYQQFLTDYAQHPEADPNLIRDDEV